MLHTILKRSFIFFLTVLNFFQGEARPIGSDTLVKRKSTEKFMDVLKVSYAGSHWDISVFEVDKESATVQELEKAAPYNSKDLEKKQYLIYPGLKSLNEKENRLSRLLYSKLKATGYADTVNKLFVDRVNMILLNARIDSIDLFFIGRKKSAEVIRTKLYVTWLLNDYFEDVTDTVASTGFSAELSTEGMGAVAYLQNTPKAAEKIVMDAFSDAYMNLGRQKKFIEQLKFIDNYKIDKPLLALPTPTTTVSDKENAGEACVVVKTKSRHGSGFAVTTDGYIITSYSAVEEAISKKRDSVRVVVADGSEFDAIIVRSNKYRNAALLKVNTHFEKAFKVPVEKKYKNLAAVYTIGTPKSAELGQSMSSGIISSERKTNNNHYIQLGMSINTGNSGGPLFNDSGELYGMTVAKLYGLNTEGLSFAIPAFLLENYLQIKFN